MSDAVGTTNVTAADAPSAPAPAAPAAQPSGTPAPSGLPEGAQLPAYQAQVAKDLRGADLPPTLNDLVKGYRELSTRPADAAAQPSVALPESPDGYELSIPEAPEGLELDEAAVAAWKAFAHENQFSPEQAQAFVNWDLQRKSEEIAAEREAIKAAAEEQIKLLQTEYGNRWQGKLNSAIGLIDKFGGQELRAELDQTGIGNNPALIRAFISLAEAMGEGSFAASGGPGEPEVNIDELYPSMRGMPDRR